MITFRDLGVLVPVALVTLGEFIMQPLIISPKQNKRADIF